MSQTAVSPARPIAAQAASLRLRAFDPLLILWVLLAAILVFLVVNPLFQLVNTSLEETDTGAFTVMNYVTAFSRPRYITAMLNSLRLGAMVTVLCLVFAVPIAWAVSRTDMPGKGLIRLLVLGAFITPPLSRRDRLDLLAGPNSGWLNRVWMAATGAGEGVLDIYTFSGLVFVIAMLLLPLHVHLHIDRTGCGVVGNGGCREYAGGRHAAHHAVHHPADGAARRSWRAASSRSWKRSPCSARRR